MPWSPARKYGPIARRRCLAKASRAKKGRSASQAWHTTCVVSFEQLQAGQRRLPKQALRRVRYVEGEEHLK